MTFVAGHSFVFCCPSVFKILGCGDGDDSPTKDIKSTSYHICVWHEFYLLSFGCEDALWAEIKVFPTLS